MDNRRLKNVVVALLSRERESGVIEYLLVKSRKDFGQFTGFWYPPGGHLKEGEEEKDALVREIKEELGLETVSVIKVATTIGDVENQLTHWWKCEIISDDMEVDWEEIAEIGWFTRNEMKSMQLWPATESFFKKYIFSYES